MQPFYCSYVDNVPGLYWVNVSTIKNNYQCLDAVCWARGMEGKQNAQWLSVNKNENWLPKKQQVTEIQSSLNSNLLINIWLHVHLLNIAT